MRQEDPPSIPHLAVPVTVPIKCHMIGYEANDPCIEAAGDLYIIAFYYLLHVGKYTLPRRVKERGKWVRDTCTVQFQVKDADF
eukprot:8233747-Ditylum_brightwellii.AAC.1